ncbi:phosphatase PAP2 family protein [Lachnoanaerobaculum umeaense]|jgi:PAP2 superfamily|uniref:Phosphatase PAP2 family protein n=1 Tax=Lachnoanaerobaculum umeaense TaxID=617123 RepID=A0A385Q0S7_9FIRM|nr:phosphatase PAP2 family protein [Lachnoanaerobaculum umeaense]AYA99882.1 phosphatase PAP2 family protein [Lachnoanaerobaculum umeaense]PZW98346.1 PAP2 superfamily protein [Lachnoanaerobaculum umeaense]
MKKLTELFRKYRHAWVFLYSFIYLSWYMYLERTIVTEYHIMYTKIDDWIPFNEFFIIPYFIWFLYVAFMLMFLFFKDVDEFYRFGLYLALGMSISLFICQIFPNGTNLRPTNLDPNKNIFTHLVAFIYKTDTPTNVFPSIHVFNSIATHVAIVRSKFFYNNMKVKVVSFIIMISICLSTLFLKQHSFLDVVGATILSYVIYQLIYAKIPLPVGHSDREDIRI